MHKDTIIKNILMISRHPYIIFSTKIAQHHDKSFATLKILSTTENVTASYLSEAFDIKPSSVTQIIKKLEEGGLVNREKSDEDSRISYLRLTDKGRENLKESDVTSDSLQNLLFKDFTEDELVNFNDYLTRLVKNSESDEFKKQLQEVFGDDERWAHFDKMSTRFGRARSHMLEAEHAHRHGHPHHFRERFNNESRSFFN